MTIISAIHNVVIGSENWSRSEGEDGILWKGNEKHFRFLNINGFWQEHPNNGWSECEEPVQEKFFQDWSRNQFNPRNAAYLYEQAVKEAKEHNLGEE